MSIIRYVFVLGHGECPLPKKMWRRYLEVEFDAVRIALRAFLVVSRAFEGERCHTCVFGGVWHVIL
jgi:hypothetical protein